MPNPDHFYAPQRAGIRRPGSKGFPAYSRVQAAVSYLRTVRFTAVVYRGFGRELAPPALTFRHRTGVAPYTSPYGLCRELCFW